MKKLSLALLVTLCLFFPSAASSASQIQSSPIWNGKADTKWYRDSETEFTITTPEQLAGLAKLVNGGNDFNGKTVKLGANIMLNDTTDWQNWASKPPKNKWKPIGTIAWRNLPSFLHGHIMRGLIDIFVPESIQRALLEPTDLSFRGTFDGGGLAGTSYGTVNGCYSVAWVAGIRAVGGLVGNSSDYSRAIIINSYSTSIVSGDSVVGGLVGRNGNGMIGNSYSANKVSGKAMVGGLVGLNDGIIANSYSTGAVSGNSIVGGLAGASIGEIIYSYSIGAVAGNSEAGGLVGSNRVGYQVGYNIIKKSYYNIETSKQSKDIGGEEDMDKSETESNAYGKIDIEMKKLETFFGWDFDKTWGIDEKINGGYPYLRSFER